MNYLFIITICFVFFVLPGCKKGSSTPKADDGEISFTCNGKFYSYNTFDGYNGVNVGAGIYGTPLILITVPNEFSGRITYQKTGCAYLLPTQSNIAVQPGCLLLDYTSSSAGAPIDSTKVFVYNSGTLYLLSSNCKTSTTNILGYSGTITSCDVNGTFDLTLQNKNGQKIVITNGIVKVRNRIM
jgi:hypothetical protein